MTQEHPITPPPELVEKWRKEPEYTDCNQLVTMVTMTTDRLMQLCEKSAQYGADQELEACCEWFENWVVNDSYSKPLRSILFQHFFADRRPKSPSLKGKAVSALNQLSGHVKDIDQVRRALEQLPANALPTPEDTND